MRVLQINVVYKKGSTGKIIYDIHSCLSDQNIDSIVCYGRGYTINEDNVYKFCSEIESKFYHLLNLFGWLMYAVCPIATRKLINIIKNRQPDLVHIHCINGYCLNIYRLLKFLGKSKIKTIVTHHAEFLYTGSCGHAYECVQFQNKSGCFKCPILGESTCSLWIDRTNEAWRKMKRAFSYFDETNIQFTAVSPWVADRIKLSPICNQIRCKSIYNGVDTQVFKPRDHSEVNEIRRNIPQGYRKVILHVTATFTTDTNNIKGGYYIKRIAEKMPQYLFVVVASNVGTVDSLPDNVRLWGTANKQSELAALYTMADLTVIASRRETFSMIVAESLCCGTPVVGFNAGGPESIAIKEYTSFVSYGDEEQFMSEVERFAESEWNSDRISTQAMILYSKEQMTRQYVSLYKDMIG